MFTCAAICGKCHSGGLSFSPKGKLTTMSVATLKLKYATLMVWCNRGAFDAHSNPSYRVITEKVPYYHIMNKMLQIIL